MLVFQSSVGGFGGVSEFSATYLLSELNTGVPGTIQWKLGVSKCIYFIL